MFKLFKNKLTERQMEAMLSNYESVYASDLGGFVLLGIDL